MARERTIRRAQAIHPYGPGAILDWGQESFVVLDTSRSAGWLSAPRTRLLRLERHLGVREGFKLPPVKEGNTGPPLSVYRFPRWLFCPSCRRLVRWTGDDERVLSRKADVPRCDQHGCEESILVPMRYVAACPNGHLSDVDWHRWAHSGRSGADGQCSPTQPKLRFLADTTRGSSLDALTISCDKCGSAQSLATLQSPSSLRDAGQACSGRQPWQGEHDRRSCSQPLHALLRSQTAVHFSTIESALDIQTGRPATEDPFEEAMGEWWNGNPFLHDVPDAALDALMPGLQRQIDASTGSTVEPAKIREWIKRRKADEPGEAATRADGSSSLLDAEWPALTTPTDQDAAGTLRVRSSGWRGDQAVPKALGALIDDVFLVERLREVRAFVDFRRVAPEGQAVPPDLRSRIAPAWLPATEVFGEGIFLKLSNDGLAAWLESQREPLNRRLAPIRSNLARSDAASRKFPDADSLLERWAVIHTFSHLLMRQLCFEAGYGAASIRERLYVGSDRAGVLIYTADGDSEGSLGGLVRQGERERLVDTITVAMERSAWCSNDPICQELPPNGLGQMNRSACHACALAPETSCTHFNLLLDRVLVVGDGLADRPKGLFRALVE
jgi:hypothetical protein